MYLRPIHTEQDQDVLVSLIHEHPLGILTTAIPGCEPLIQSSHVPFVLDVGEEVQQVDVDPNAAPNPSLPTWAVPRRTLTLRGHLARANPQAKALIAHKQAEVQILFHPPAQGYVTPRWYVASKPADGKVVPTWNYMAVQVYGTLRVHENGEFVRKQIEDLTDAQESKVDGKWKVSDAPDRYVDLLQKAIIGVQIDVTHISGKVKMSQEMGDEDARGVAEGFRGLGTEVGDDIARVVQERRRS